MSSLIGRLTSAVAHHWKRSLLIALGTLVVLGALAGTATKPADTFDVPGADSQKAVDLFRDHTPAFAGAAATLVYSVERGKLSDPGPRAVVAEALGRVGGLKGVASVDDPFAKGAAVSQDGRLAAVTVRYTTDPADIKVQDGKDLEQAGQTPEGSRVSVAMRGIPIDTAAQQEAPVGELVGVLLGMILLTLLFRSKAAMVTTLLGALVGVMVGQLLLAVLAQPLGLPSFATTIAVMLGLGAGIDYSLLIIHRFREQRATGQSVREAVGDAGATAGTAVVAAGLIVMVAIAGLLVVGVPSIGKMGVGAAIGVFAVVLSALLILPAFIGAFARWLTPKKSEHSDPSLAFARWADVITRKPWATIAAGVTVLLIFALPLLDMRLGQPDDGNQPASKTQRRAYDQLSKAFGPGSNGPLLLAIDTSNAGDDLKADLARVESAVRQDKGVASVTPATPSKDGQIATMIVTPTTSPQDKATSDLLARLRNSTLPAATSGTALRVYVGGITAGFEDFSSKIASRLPLFIGVVISLSVLLLMAAFRSLLIPLISAVFNLLSVAAAYGAVTAVFQKNIGAELIGASSGVPIVSFVPVLLFAILFGLSMDYNVFLLSRMHEAYNRGEKPRQAVITGMANIGQVVLFAGLIMAAVFLSFVLTDDVISKMFGVGLGLAILVDVLIVRLVISPAVVTLLGDRAWWLPAWLDRILPNISLEGHVEDEQVEGE